MILDIKGRLYTQSDDFLQWYDEKIIKKGNRFLREFTPKKSKIAAAVKKGLNIDFNKSILYLGASTGTTVSHLSDITKKPIVGVDVSAFVLRDFLMLSKRRENVFPLMHDASKISELDFIKNEKFEIIFQDISQRDMVETFIQNFKHFSTKDSIGLLSLKTKSIDSSVSSNKTLEVSMEKIRKANLKISQTYNLEPFEKEHYLIVVKH